MEQFEVKNFSNLPMKDEQRKRTDIFCTILNTIFVLLIFIISIASLNLGTLRKMTYPSDGDGNPCGLDNLQNYPILYFASFNDPAKRLCVSQCPKAGASSLNCFPTETLSCNKNTNLKYEVQVYDSVLEQTRMGLFCWPNDQAKKELLLETSGISQKYGFLAFYDAMWVSMGISFALGCIYLALMQYFPRKVVPFVVLIGGITFFILAFLTVFVATGSVFVRILVGIAMLLLSGMCLYTIYKDERRKELFICTRLLQLSQNVVKQNYLTLLAIPIFIFLLVMLIILIAFQILAAWSVGKLQFHKQYPFYGITGFLSNFLTLLIFFEFYWGMSFLKEAFNFIVSGYAVQWYCYKQDEPQNINIFQSPKLLVKHHWGSVLGGSLLLGLFYFVDLIIDFFFNTEIEQAGHISHKEKIKVREELPEAKVTDFFNLIRSQTMGYLNLIQIPYCNGSRYCELMSTDSSFYDNSQTTNRIFRLGAHAVLVSIVTFISLVWIKGKSGQSNVFGIVFIIVISIFILTFFISFHGDIAEGLLICIFTEQRLENKIKRPPSIVREVYKQDQDEVYQDKSIMYLLMDNWN